MQLLLDKLTSYIAPFECLACGVEGALLCKDCIQLVPQLQPRCYKCHQISDGATTCKSCRKSSLLDAVWVATPYEGFAEALIQQLKFQRAISAAEIIAYSMLENFGDQLPDNVIIVPIPTASSRIRQRGYDQSVMIAKQLAKKTQLPYANILTRYGQARQTGKSRHARLRQLTNAFQVKHHVLPKDTRIILIDDVLTTGATLEAAAKCLHDSGLLRIQGAVFASADHK